MYVHNFICIDLTFHWHLHTCNQYHTLRLLNKSCLQNVSLAIFLLHEPFNPDIKQCAVLCLSILSKPQLPPVACGARTNLFSTAYLQKSDCLVCFKAHGEVDGSLRGYSVVTVPRNKKEEEKSEACQSVRRAIIKCYFGNYIVQPSSKELVKQVFINEIRLPKLLFFCASATVIMIQNWNFKRYPT